MTSNNWKAAWEELEKSIKDIGNNLKKKEVSSKEKEQILNVLAIMKDIKKKYSLSSPSTKKRTSAATGNKKNNSNNKKSKNSKSRKKKNVLSKTLDQVLNYMGIEI